MMQIYGSPGSSAGRCYWTLEEVGAPYEAVAVNFRNGDNKKPEYLRMNPNGKIPLLRDGDSVIWESMAIDCYLAEKYQPELLGTSAEARALVLQWSFWSLVEYQKPIIDVFIQKVFVPEPQRDQKIIEKGLEKIQPLNRILNEHLTDREYMVGTSFTLADLHVASVAKICTAIGVSLDVYPHTHQWLARMLARPAAQRVAQLEAK